MSESEMEVELERLRAENTQLKSKDTVDVVLKVTLKGAVSLYGIGRSMITLNKEQWLFILANGEEVETLIDENDSKLPLDESRRLISLAYRSTASINFSEEDLAALLNQSRENNLRLGVSGLLLYKNGEFMQALEGEQDVVDTLYSHIEQDSRHTGAILLRENLATRRFPDWCMGFANLHDTDIRQMPGYSPFMDEPLEWPGFKKDPSRVQKLFAFFSGHRADSLAQLERLRVENDQLKRGDKKCLALKVSGTGSLSLYGIDDLPVMLSKERWHRLLANVAKIRAFISENDSKLKADGHKSPR